jgi:hypothetical protein
MRWPEDPSLNGGRGGAGGAWEDCSGLALKNDLSRRPVMAVVLIACGTCSTATPLSSLIAGLEVLTAAILESREAQKLFMMRSTISSRPRLNGSPWPISSPELGPCHSSLDPSASVLAWLGVWSPTTVSRPWRRPWRAARDMTLASAALGSRGLKREKSLARSAISVGGD